MPRSPVRNQLCALNNARTEPDPYVKQAFDFGLLEDFDHLYRYRQMLDLIRGKDPNEILQGRTDVLPARPTQDQERAWQNTAHEIP